LGYPIDAAPLLALAAESRGRTIGRPQIADALVAAGHARSRSDAFDTLLAHGRPAFVARTGSTCEQAIDIVTRAGGIVSMAHPGLLGRDDIIPRLAAGGLASLEVRHSDHDDAAEQKYRALAASLGLAVSGGSDFHAETGHRTAAIGRVTLPAADFAALEARAR
jgi:hypothetical protein